VTCTGLIVDVGKDAHKQVTDYNKTVNIAVDDKVTIFVNIYHRYDEYNLN